MSLSSHQSVAMKSDTWLTPPEWIEALGPFDLDPCCPPIMPWKTAKIMLDEGDDGLKSDWAGFVWCNPPFGREAALWLQKLANHQYGIALIPARTETVMFQDYVWDRAQAICFVTGRPHFHYADGSRAPFNSGAPICLVAYGKHAAFRLRQAKLGPVVSGWRERHLNLEDTKFEVRDICSRVKARAATLAGKV